ncbi:MAG: HNH endonuclease [Anaerolineae bacterium]
MSKRKLLNMLIGFVLLVVAVLLVVYQSPGGSQPPAAPGGQQPAATLATALPTPRPQQTTAPTALGRRTKTSSCVATKALPDPACTPGAIFSDATKDQVCVPGYSSQVRNVPEEVKKEVYAEYGITHHSPGEYEVDHLISLELGGSNDIANLWPEPAEPRPGFHEKDRVEDYLHAQVCKNAISLQQAQVEIATDWFKVYQHLPQ